MRATKLIPAMAVASAALALTAALALAQSPSPSAVPAVSAPPSASASVAPSAAAMQVGVTLADFTITPDTTGIPAGGVTFNVTNTSTELEHEFVVVRTDLPGGELPTLEDGSFDEDGEGVEVLGEVEELAPGASGTLTLDLAAGRYVFVCNVVEEGLSHYASGMWLDAEVAGTAIPSGSVPPVVSISPVPSAPASPSAS